MSNKNSTKLTSDLIILCQFKNQVLSRFILKLYIFIPLTAKMVPVLARTMERKMNMISFYNFQIFFADI